MTTVTLEEVQNDLLTLLQRIEQGETFLIVSGKHALAELRPVASAATELRPYGLCVGQFAVPLDFDQPLPAAIVKDFVGE